MDDNIETNVSTFAAEMKEIAFILHNIDRRSLAIIDELGRGTSTRDGLAIALAIAEALVNSKAFVWFATHFKDLATILAERQGVKSMHLAADVGENNTMTMHYRIVGGAVAESHYGLALASVVPLPPGLVERATLIAAKLERRNLKKKKASATIIRERKRKLILDLKDHLIRAYNGDLDGTLLTEWLMLLQKEFIMRMEAIDAEEADANQDSEEEFGSDEEMMSRSEYGQPRDNSYTRTRQPSVISIDSKVSSSRSTTVRSVSESMSDVRAVSENDY